MTRLFRRGELKAALVDALAGVGPANGYVLMQALAERIGGGWQPSPGAVYPALLGLEDAGLIGGREQQGTRVYELTAAGRRSHASAGATLDRVAARARTAPLPAPTLGAVLDRFAARCPGRQQRLDDGTARAVDDLLDRLDSDLDQLIKGDT
ncbi:hypothetical protein BH20ACT2_BH20ACT2_17520 [soil metagenome]